jgi:hypothetical protein
MDQDTFQKCLESWQHKAILDAGAFAAYHAETDWPVIQALVCDDAPQFNWLAELMLCWAHQKLPEPFDSGARVIWPA